MTAHHDTKTRWALTPRQQEVLQLRCRGLCIKEIAYNLGMSKKTAENYWAQVGSKVGTTNPVVVCQWAIHHGFAVGIYASKKHHDLERKAAKLDWMKKQIEKALKEVG